MKKYVWISIGFFILLYFGPSLTAPVTHPECMEAALAAEMYENGTFAIERLDRYLVGVSLELFGNNALGLRFGNIIVVALMSFLMMFAVKKCINDTMTGVMSSLIFFTSFWCFYSPLIPQNTVWGEFFNVLALGAFFMASRENRFSIQRISLLLLCGFLTALSLIINGMSPFFMSFIIAVVFLLWEKKYCDMLLMPLVISAVTLGFLLLHGYYIHHAVWYELCELVKDFQHDIASLQAGNNLSELFKNLRLMVIGILPSSVFLLCALFGFKGYVRHFFKQSIYRFSLIFLLAGIGSVLLNNEVFIADLPLTYLPYSFLVGAGFVNYMRTRNRHVLFNSLMLIFAFFLCALSCYYLISDNFDITRNFALAIMVWGVFILLSYMRPKSGSRIKAYFLGLSVGLFASMSVLWHNQISAAELEGVLRIAVDTSEDDKYEMFATPGMYYIIRFYIDDDVKKIADGNGAVITELPSEINKIMAEKDVVIFARDGEISPELMKKARTLDAKKFKLHLFVGNE